MTDEEYKAIRSHNRDHYGLGFFKFTDEDHGESNLLFGEVLWQLYKPTSVIDFGCGTAGTLSTLLQHGVDVLGIDGFPSCLPLIARRDPELASKHIQIHDLSTPWKDAGNKVFDLAISIEFLEHLAPEAADIAVTSIANSAKMAIVTAAPPSGGNELHLNEQPFTYWIEKFAANRMQIDHQKTTALAKIMRGHYDAFIQQRGCLIPTWFFDSYIGIFNKE